jgi:hypothetical protein
VAYSGLNIIRVMPQEKNRLPLWSLKMGVKLLGRPTGVSDELKSRISELGCIFIHIPKCAGNAVQKSLFGDVVFGHQTVRQYQIALPNDTYQNAWKFTITRDPFDRIVSAWRFLKAGGLNANDKKYFAETLSKYETFDHFVNDWLVYQDVDQCGCAHFKSQLHYICDFKGKQAIDCTVKLSSLQRVYPQLRKRFAGGELITANKHNQPLDYIQLMYKSQETLANIHNIYVRDFETLGYEMR